MIFLSEDNLIITKCNEFDTICLEIIGRYLILICYTKNDRNKNSYSLSCTIFCIDFQQYRDPIHENIQKYTFVQHDALLSA